MKFMRGIRIRYYRALFKDFLREKLKILRPLKPSI
jgi:hypothetical protein